MEWWQPVSMAGTVVVTLVTVLTLGWRVLERMRLENRIAHDKIGDSIAKLRDDLTRDIGAVRGDLDGKVEGLRHDLFGKMGSLRDDLHGEVNGLRDDLFGKMGSLRHDLHGEVTGLRDDLTGKIEGLRHDLTGQIDGKIGGLREDLNRDIHSLGDRLGTEIATNRQGLVAVGEGLAELRGELKGVNRSLQDLRQDFRTHVYGGNAAA